MPDRSLAILDRFLSTRPRVDLGIYPTPLVRLERASADLGVDLWMKRDECSGLALGGNKTRKLEFILADAMARGFRTVVTVGPLTSNHTMMTAAAARRMGLQVHCVIGGSPPPRPSGNLLLLDYMGAELHFSPIDYVDPSAADADALRRLCHQVSEATGGYWIPGGGTMPVAEPGYMSAIAELAHQRGGRFDFDRVVVALGTGSTMTGLLLGLGLAGFACQVEGVAVSKRSAIETAFRRPTVGQLFVKSAAALGLDLRPDEVPAHRTVYGFAEEGYGVSNRGSDQAIRYLVQREGYFLDPVYTAKAFSGLMGMVEDGRIPKGCRVLFVHTGGLSMTPAAEKRYAGQVWILDKTRP